MTLYMLSLVSDISSRQKYENDLSTQQKWKYQRNEKTRLISSKVHLCTQYFFSLIFCKYTEAVSSLTRKHPAYCWPCEKKKKKKQKTKSKKQKINEDTNKKIRTLI